MQQVNGRTTGELDDPVLGQELAEVVNLDPQISHQGLDSLMRAVPTVDPPSLAIPFLVNLDADHMVSAVFSSPL